MRSIQTMVLVAAVLISAPATMGCGASDPNAKVLNQAVYAKSVPVYRGAKFTQTMGNESWGDDSDSYTQGETWWFETKASKAEVLAYYEKLYPNAEKTELDTGDTQLRFKPEGSDNFEDVTIVVGEHELRIGESVRPNTKARLHREG